MAEKNTEEEVKSSSNVQLDSGTYEVLRSRLDKGAKELRERLYKLNEERKSVFGSIEQKLVGTDRITTENNCVPRDMFSLGPHLIFGYNVHIGLRSETVLEDVFSIYVFQNRTFTATGLDLIRHEIFESDFKELYKYYKNTFFEKFAVIGPYLHMVFRIGKNPNDFKTFKWLIQGNSLKYEGNRSEHEFKFPSQFEFDWQRTSRDYHRKGKHPHVSVLDKVFIETVAGDLTIKIEDNTETGEGIYTEPVEDVDQRLDDAEMYYADLGNIILLKIRPFKEENFRYLVYNHKIKKVHRIDAIKDSCVLLPEGHGIIFSKGYYLQTGEFKLFENELQGLKFEKRIMSPNGEDYLYVFYNTEFGAYILLPYNVIQQKVDNLILCHGFSIFNDGDMIYFLGDEDPSKHHVIQVWNTPFVGQDYEPPVVPDSYLYKIGNKDIVRAMSECAEVLNLLNKDDESYANLYLDLVRKTTDVLDSYFWIRDEKTFNLGEPLADIKTTASATIEEFEKVVRVKRNTQEQFKKQTDRTKEILEKIKRTKFEDINTFVSYLSELRSLRGDIISLKDLRYADLAIVEELDKKVSSETDKVSQACVQFLLEDKSLQPYQDKVILLRNNAEKVAKVTEANQAEEEVQKVSSELEMLINIVSNLKIEDATQTTRIIDNISFIFAEINQLKSSLRNRKNDLRKNESSAEFHAQIKLLDQSIANYLDVSTTPDKCDEYLSKLMIQLEELEGKFSDFDGFLGTITDKREEIYEAFENKKLALVEARNNKANSLMAAAERVLSGVRNKLSTFETPAEINGYYASDIMVSKLRDIVQQLTELGDSVKSDDIQGRMKSLKEEAIRQLKDKKELFVQGANVVKFGKFHFSVNTQPLDLAIVQKQDKMFFHITGTSFFEEVTDEEMNASKALWSQLYSSENETVYRSEYLAYCIYKDAEKADTFSLQDLLKKTDEELLKFIQEYMAPRYSEGYVKGVNDKDSLLILKTLLAVHSDIDLLKYTAEARTLGRFYWTFVLQDKDKFILNAKLKAAGSIIKIFGSSSECEEIKTALEKLIREFVNSSGLFSAAVVKDAASYLFEELSRGDEFVVSQDAETLQKAFTAYVKKKKSESAFETSINKLKGNTIAQFEISKNWVKTFISSENLKEGIEFSDEAALLLLSAENTGRVIKVKPDVVIKGMSGTHAVIQNSEYHFHYNRFIKKLENFQSVILVSFENFLKKKNYLVEKMKQELRLEDYKTNVLSSFVRNKLIDEVYLPLIGANLAKQMGVVGENKRTDQMGMLLLISPPGYGKTTLMEYIASRLGIIFMKINGPAIGHKITSVDPAEAPNAAAREELEKLNLAFEMGDNVMIYLDDIQHCNPEFLQKFISLCDAQRKIEGVYKGRSRTYDFRGKKVCVVMAGNPYTESGEKFKIPDMLANRADTYNLGDILGDKEDVFKLSYVENSLTSNPITAKVAAKSLKDIYSFIKLTETGDSTGLDFEGTYTAEETNEIVSVLKKLMVIREIVLKVNQEYIRSASQADEFRTEPPFKLQGSYRNMNKMTERIVPVMNDDELKALIVGHYQSESQTLTTGAEANFLKFKDLSQWIREEEKARWEEIKTTFKKNQKFRGLDSGNQLSQLLAQLSTLGEGVEGIKEVLERGLNRKIE